MSTAANSPGASNGATASNPTTTSGGGGPSSSGTNAGAIAGGVVGGMVALTIITLLCCYFTGMWNRGPFGGFTAGSGLYSGYQGSDGYPIYADQYYTAGGVNGTQFSGSFARRNYPFYMDQSQSYYRSDNTGLRYTSGYYNY